MTNLETNDIQGLITKGYSNLPACKFLLLQITDKDAAKKWLKNIVSDVTHSNAKHDTTAINIAFTFDGLKALGLSAASLDSFPLEFEDGMATAHKQLFLGDFGDNAPANWDWGGKQSEAVHILLLLYAATDAQLVALYSAHAAQFATCGLKEQKQFPTTVLEKRKEHFGFHDGIAQPTIDGLNRQDVATNTVAPGEFILGYKNSYDQYPDTPMVAASGDNNMLSQAAISGMLDLGKNGSYLVFRQIEQDVEMFWDYMEKASNSSDSSDPHEMIKLAAKMVGRWPGGAPVTTCPDKEIPKSNDQDNFAYRSDEDGSGLKCPMGAHIRRTNPRDSLDTLPHQSIEISNKHRILRRGRSYGEPVCKSLDPQEILKQKNIEGKRGLHFICINTNISRQFEFIQNAWVNNPQFLTLYNERDPIIGNNMNPESDTTDGNFSVPSTGLRKKYTAIPRFTTVKGGAYFFLPGIKALTYLATMK
jgi:Dyp-type peroxidase family